jgi:glycosyltransferase involved in cell wall biosynthesis
LTNVSDKKIKLARVATVSIAFTPILKTIEDLKNKKEFDVSLITSKDEYNSYLEKVLNLTVKNVTIPRDISIINDLKSLWNLFLHYKKHDYKIVHSNTPKAGLISALAAILAGVDIRLHTFTGQRWATLSGPKRTLLKLIDKLIIKLNTKCYADSDSQIQYLVDEGVAKKGDIICLGDGSYGGVDIHKFSIDKSDDFRNELYSELGINEKETTFLYVGRVTRDKGINETIEALKNIDNARFILIGVLDSSHNLAPETLDFLQNNPKVHMLGFKENPEYYMKACDVLLLPSYREGFGTVVIEAAACGTCCIGTDIPGLKDAIVNDETGLLVPKYDVIQLQSAMQTLVDDREKLRDLSLNAYKRAREDFSSERLSELQVQSYKELISRS